MSRGQQKGARSRGRRSGPRGGRRGDPRDEAAARKKLEAARAARKVQKRAEAVERKVVEAKEQERRREARSRPRAAIEPAIYEDRDAEQPFRAGWVALLGRPNVGKSTLLNALLGQKLAATTHKPQTTRKNLLGALNPPGAQLLILDTPGHHQAKGPLNRFMVAQAEDAVRNADVIAFVVEARTDGKLTPGNTRLLEVVKKADKPVVVVLNKIDLVKDKQGMLHQIAALNEALGERLEGLVPISARGLDGLEDLVRSLARALPEAEAPIIDEEEVTDQSESQIVAELIREKAMIELKDELPYSVAVTLDRFEDIRPKLVRIIATLHVERPSQKGIVIGKQGVRLKAIGARARKDIEFLVGCKVYLELAVRVTTDWTRDQRRLKDLGYTKTKDEGGPTAQEVADAIAQLPPEVLAELEADDFDAEDDFDDEDDLEDDEGLEGEALEEEEEEA